MAFGAERQGLRPGHMRQRHAPVKMRKERPPARGLPFQRRAHAVRVERDKHQPVLAGDTVPAIPGVTATDEKGRLAEFVAVAV